MTETEFCQSVEDLLWKIINSKKGSVLIVYIANKDGLICSMTDGGSHHNRIGEPKMIVGRYDSSFVNAGGGFDALKDDICWMLRRLRIPHQYCTDSQPIP